MEAESVPLGWDIVENPPNRSKILAPHSSENRLLWHRPLTTKPLSNIVSDIVSIAQQSSTMLTDVDSSREKKFLLEIWEETQQQLVSRTSREQLVDLPTSTQGLISPSDNVLLVLSGV